MLPTIRLFLLSVLSLILFSAVGIVMGILGVSVWIRLDSTGIFVRWQLLDSPHKFQHLMNANQSQVLAQTDDGNIYLYDTDYCDGTTGRNCDEWVEWPPDQEINSLRNTIVESECKFATDHPPDDLSYSIYAKPRNPPQKESIPQECVISLEHYPTGGETLTYYVLLENGEVWKWIHKSAAMQYFGTAVRWALVGLLIGIVIWIRFEILKLNLKEPLRS